MQSCTMNHIHQFPKADVLSLFYLSQISAICSFNWINPIYTVWSLIIQRRIFIDKFGSVLLWFLNYYEKKLYFSKKSFRLYGQQ